LDSLLQGRDFSLQMSLPGDIPQISSRQHVLLDLGWKRNILTGKHGSRIVNGSVTVARNYSRSERNTTVGFLKGASSSTKILANLAIPPNASMATVEPFYDNRKPARAEVLLVVGEVKFGSNDFQNIIRSLTRKSGVGNTPLTANTEAPSSNSSSDAYSYRRRPSVNTVNQ